jgi:hypothetical protein
MKKGNKKQKEETVIVEPIVVEVVETVKKGRKVNPESARQKRLIELEAKRKSGVIKKGRPVSTQSARQKRLAEMEARKAANNGTIKKGRPVNSESARQQRLVKKVKPDTLVIVENDIVELEKGE